jgi:hypothetical protein
MAIEQDHQELTDLLNKVHNNSMAAIRAKIDHFKSYVYYLNENRNLKYQELTMKQTPRGSWFYYCKFTEPAFILGIFCEGYNTQIPSNSLSSLSVKEIAFRTLNYYNDTWIESEDFRKVDSYFAFTNSAYNG